MATDEAPAWPRLSLARRVVPTAAVLALIAAATVVATAHGTTSRLERRYWTTPALRALADDPRLPLTYDEARQAGTVDQYDWGQRCDSGDPKAANANRRRSRLMVPSIYSPPCVPVWDGAKPWRDRGGRTVNTNGGRTARGVTATTITVAYYVPAGQDIAAQLQAFGVIDGPELSYRGAADLVGIYNRTYQLYGRRVVLKRFDASGDGRNPALARADARSVAEDMGAFASIGGPTQTQAYQDELARRGVMCIGCGYGTTDAQYKADAPYAWGHLASPDQLLDGLFRFGAQSLWDRKAKFAGDPALRAKTRVFGVVHYEQDPPVFGPLKSATIAKFAKQGRAAKVIRSYLLDLNSLASQARDIIGELKRSGVTTVVFLGDPVMPKFLTEQAAQQDYWPEWVITGTVFTDTTAVGRLYDQKEWAHAFGASSPAARVRPDQSDSWHVYKWWYGKDPAAKKTMTLLGPVIQEMFIGLQGAGPHLSATTFAGAMFRYPVTPTVPTATAPQISFGFHAGFPNADFVAVDDFSTVWWDSDLSGPDEAGRVTKGMWRYVFSGVRFPLANPVLPTGLLKTIGITEPEDLLFAPPTSPAITPLPPDQGPPADPPWPGSPTGHR